MVPDRFVAPVRMTARAYLCHHGRIRGLTTAQAERRAAELGERLGVLPGLDAAVQDLSKGNAEKIALAQAFLVPVDLLVLDEPRTALDAQAAAVLDELLDAATEVGTTVVLSDPTPGPSYPDAHRYQLAGGHVQPVAHGTGRNGRTGPGHDPASSPPARRSGGAIGLVRGFGRERVAWSRAV